MLELPPVNALALLDMTVSNTSNWLIEVASFVDASTSVQHLNEYHLYRLSVVDPSNQMYLGTFT